MSVIDFTPAANGEFWLGDKVRVVLEGTLESYDRDLGYYLLRGHSIGAQHIDWLIDLHWATDFHVIEPGPRIVVDGDNITRGSE